MLLSQVDELEVHGERAEHEPFSVGVEAGYRVSKRLAVRRTPGGSSVAGERADPLFLVEQLPALLLDEHAAEDVAEEPDIPAQPRVGRGRARLRSHYLTG